MFPLSTVVDLTHPDDPDKIAFAGSFLPGFTSSTPSLPPLAELLPGRQDLAGRPGRGPCLLRLALSSHTGTHIDVPAHFFNNDRHLDHLGPERFVGPGVVFDVRGLKSISREALLPYSDHIAKASFLLLHTGWDALWGGPDYFRGYPTLSTPAAEWLCNFSLKGLGVDAISVDAPKSAEAVHQLLLGHGLLLIENLKNIHQLPPSGFTFSCLPVPVAGGDGSPVRALAIMDTSF